MYLFTTGWEVGKVWPSKRMSKRQKRESNEMEAPFLVWYEDDQESLQRQAMQSQT